MEVTSETEGNLGYESGYTRKCVFCQIKYSDLSVFETSDFFCHHIRYHDPILIKKCTGKGWY